MVPSAKQLTQGDLVGNLIKQTPQQYYEFAFPAKNKSIKQ